MTTLEGLWINQYFMVAVCILVTESSSWRVTGARQANSIRSLYLKTILRQDIEFFDTETTAGEVIGRLSGDTILIEDAMGEKVNSFHFELML